MVMENPNKDNGPTERGILIKTEGPDAHEEVNGNTPSASTAPQPVENQTVSGDEESDREEVIRLVNDAGKYIRRAARAMASQMPETAEMKERRRAARRARRSRNKKTQTRAKFVTTRTYNLRPRRGFRGCRRQCSA